MIGRYSGQGPAAYAVVFIVAGFLLIGLGWVGAAATLFIPTQVAYAVSGSLAGLALIGTGAALLDLQATRILDADRSHDLDGFITEAAELLARLSARTSTADDRHA